MSHLFLPCVDSFVCYLFDTRKQKWLDDSSACKLNETLTVCSLSGGSIITLRNQDLTTYITQGCREQKNTNLPNKSFEVIIKEATSISSPLCFMHVFSLGTQHHIKTLGLGWVLPPGSWHPPTFVGNIYKLLPQLYLQKPLWGWQLLGDVIWDRTGGCHGHGPTTLWLCSGLLLKSCHMDTMMLGPVISSILAIPFMFSLCQGWGGQWQRLTNLDW